MNVLGIDPGASGGMAHISDDGAITTWKMPENDDDLADLISEIQVCMGIDICIVEKQGARPATAPHPSIPGHTVQVQGITSTWTFAEHYGTIRGILATLKISREFIAPREWQKYLGIPARMKNPQESHTAFKNRLKQKAMELFPGTRVILATSDAILISEYARRKHS